MAKFELKIYDEKTGKVAKTLQRGFMPVSLYVRYQKLSEKVINEKLKSDEDLFFALKDLFCETFNDLTEDEYLNATDVSNVLSVWREVLEKSTQLESGNSSKNG
jgi:hypothetical protein